MSVSRSAAVPCQVPSMMDERDDLVGVLRQRGQQAELALDVGLLGFLRLQANVVADLLQPVAKGLDERDDRLVLQRDAGVGREAVGEQVVQLQHRKVGGGDPLGQFDELPGGARARERVLRPQPLEPQELVDVEAERLRQHRDPIDAAQHCRVELRLAVVRPRSARIRSRSASLMRNAARMPGTWSAIVPVIWSGLGGKLATASTSLLRNSRW